MKSRRRLPAFLLTFLVCAFGALCESAWSAGSSPSLPAPAQKESSDVIAKSPQEETSIPGPLRSFLRMTAISQQISPAEVLPLLARNIVVSGYQGGKPTQYLILVNWYMDQARDLQ